MKKKSLMASLLLFAVSVFSLGTSFAQDTVPREWHYQAELYMMFPNMTGETTVGIIPPATIDANKSDILGHLKMGAMFYLQATNDTWTISTDFIYMKLKQNAENNKLIESGAVTMKELAWQTDLLYKITPWLDAGLGGRLVSVNAGIDMTGTLDEQYTASGTKTWYDPVIVVRTQGVIKDKWLLQFRGDIGGFGIGSNSTWQIQTNVGYKFSKLFQTTIGYRYIAIDYDKGDGKDRFLYDIDTFGWVVRLGFNF
jgi:hypothetical protein